MLSPLSSGTYPVLKGESSWNDPLYCTVSPLPLRGRRDFPPLPHLSPTHTQSETPIRVMATPFSDPRVKGASGYATRWVSSSSVLGSYAYPFFSTPMEGRTFSQTLFPVNNEPSDLGSYPFSTPGWEEMVKETDQHRLRQRQKQIAFGKVTVGYAHYRQQVPKAARQRGCLLHPVTPQPNVKMSKRKWDAMVAHWRRSLHRWDHIAEPEGSPSLSKEVKEDGGDSVPESLEQEIEAMRGLIKGQTRDKSLFILTASQREREASDREKRENENP